LASAVDRIGFKFPILRVFADQDRTLRPSRRQGTIRITAPTPVHQTFGLIEAITSYTLPVPTGAKVRLTTSDRGSGPVYLQISDYLRQRLTALGPNTSRRLPTEAELMLTFGVSRQTARRAYDELVARGLVERSRGRGTFPAQPHTGLSVESVEDMLALSDDREIRVSTPLRQVRNPAAATKLGIPSNDIAYVDLVLSRSRQIFGVAQLYLPLHVAALLYDVEFLRQKGAVGLESVSSILDRRLPRPIAMAKQVIVATQVDTAMAEQLMCREGRAVLQVETLYFDTDARPVHLVVNFFNPELHEYRAQLARRTDHRGWDASQVGANADMAVPAGIRS
jgi:GntR family transcriptional regulator